MMRGKAILAGLFILSQAIHPGVRAENHVPLALAGPESIRWEQEANLFLKVPGLHITSKDVDEKLKDAWLRFSGQNQDGDISSRTIMLDAADSSLAFADVNAGSPDNNWEGVRACTEGQGWALMIAVQMNDKPMFDKLWRFTKKYMQIKSFDPNTRRGAYFAWQVLPQKKGGAILKNPNDGPAPDGEIWISSALTCAAGRWGNEGPIRYLDEAHAIESTMLHIDEWNGYKQNPDGSYQGQVDMVKMFQNLQVCFIPGVYPMGPQKVSAHCISDPSYCLPAFFELFARTGPEADRNIWHEIALHARRTYLPRALGQSDDSPNDNKKTGVSPYLTLLDGTQYDAQPESGHTSSGDGLRTPSNVGMDYLWWSDGSRDFTFHEKFSNKFLSFLADPTITNPGMNISPFKEGSGFPYDYKRFWYGIYYTSGSDWIIRNKPESQGNNSSNHNEASTGMNAVLAHAASIDARWKFVEELWGAHQPRRSINGSPRTYGEPYWDGNLYLLGLIETAGRMRPWMLTGATFR